uniref:Putative secreted peptide n=1 Tax=Anopheles braziliensis TaxID=58242 RepID=A0A2M3ZQP6_9DIPT
MTTEATGNLRLHPLSLTVALLLVRAREEVAPTTPTWQRQQPQQQQHLVAVEEMKITSARSSTSRRYRSGRTCPKRRKRSDPSVR